jgi:hypothetical protein
MKACLAFQIGSLAAEWIRCGPGLASMDQAE